MFTKLLDTWARIFGMARKKNGGNALREEIREEIREEVWKGHERRKDRATFLEIKALQCICCELKKLNQFLRSAKSLKITQRSGAMNDSVQGVPAGSTTAVFDVSTFPTGSELQAGNIPQWSVDDIADVSLSPAADGSKVGVSVSASAPVGSSFNLTVTAVSLDGTALTDTVNVPILPPVTPPPPVAATALTINQQSQ